MKNLKKSVCTLIAVTAALTLLLSGCSSSSAAYDNAKEEVSYAPSAAYEGYDFSDGDSMMLYSTALSDMDSSSNSGDTSSEKPASTPSPAPQDGNTGEIERKIIRNADIDIDADDAKECYASILAYAVELGGYESSCNMDKREYDNSRFIYINATLKLPPEKLDEFVSRVGDYGSVTSSNVTSNEITDSYYDLQTRLESKQTALKSYYALLKKAETIEEILSIQSRIDEITEEIESVKGKLKVYDALVDESTVTLSITERYNMPIEEKEFTWDSLTFSSFLRLIKNGFLGVCNFLWSLLQWLVIIIISASPILLIIAVILLIRRRMIKTGKIKKREKKHAADRRTPNYVQITPVPASSNVPEKDNDDNK